MKRTKPSGIEHDQASIKWIRLQEICLSLARPGDIVHVHGSTDLPIDLRAAVAREGRRIDLMMNLLYNKNRDEVLESVAHEMAHVVLGTEDHGQAFSRKWAELRRTIPREYRDREFLAKARSLAKAHLARCEDKAGKPKFDHAERVAARLSSTVEKTVAYLHDLIEDSATYSREQLKEDFPPKIAAAVLAMTRGDKAEPYMSYIRQLDVNPPARKVKLADLDDNLDPNRPIPDKALAAELRARYLEAYEYMSRVRDPKKSKKPERL